MEHVLFKSDKFDIDTNVLSEDRRMIAWGYNREVYASGSNIEMF